MQRLRSLHDESGQAVLLAAVGMAAILGFLALAIDVGQLRYTKRQLQMQADAAAIAGALELGACAGTANCSALQSAAQGALTENGVSTSSLVTNCGTPSATGVTLSVNNGPCALGSTDPNQGNPAFVEVVLTKQQPTYFAKVLGFNNVPIAARAEAARSTGPCMIALDPSGANAITVDLLAGVVAPCGMLDESKASGFLNGAFSCLGSLVQVSKIDVAGGTGQLLCAISPTPNINATVPTPADPLATLPKPTVPPCGTSTSSPYFGSASALTILGTAVLYPDYAYCGGITILPGSTVTFKPGLYSLTSKNGSVNKYPGGLTISLGTSVSGSGVTFYNYGPSGGVTTLLTGVTLGGINLTAPTSGPYAGILFYQDPGNTSQATLLGSPLWNTKLEGSYYFPKAKVVYALSGPAKYNILVAYDIEFAVLSLGLSYTSSFTNDYSSLASGSPVSGTGAVLVQ